MAFFRRSQSGMFKRTRSGTCLPSDPLIGSTSMDRLLWWISRALLESQREMQHPMCASANCFLEDHGFFRPTRSDTRSQADVTRLSTGASCVQARYRSFVSSIASTTSGSRRCEHGNGQSGAGKRVSDGCCASRTRPPNSVECTTLFIHISRQRWRW